MKNTEIPAKEDAPQQQQQCPLALSIPILPLPTQASDETNFLSLQSAEFQALYGLYASLSSPPRPPKEIVQALSSFVSSSYNIPPSPASKIAALAVRSFSSPSFPSLFADASASSSFILSSDAAAFSTLTSADPHSVFPLRSLLMSFLVQYRRAWHPKGWVRYDRRAILHLAGLDAASSQTKEDLISYLHREYGLEMQVIGSASPTPCFLFQWAKDHPESPSNPRIDLGPYSPSSVYAAVLRFGGHVPDDGDNAAHAAPAAPAADDGNPT